ncbi:monovalent cation:proton antiporter-2 (CPA2) family protein [Azospirillum thermophilum]|uniref:Glutathione-regulated potassium-efflux system protein KefB n=1 Tax=Azospirillum thermophilum TaxID=2202148 RepID=A0A2S2CR75_9PROT|nr:monovalent cation:proton antiporter-2 (CPA2) family protein [Azospirillum thermophilum]AWK86959.1 glutathione-regulated potassium-efflux system protein KefB [Azospirillum thermophilum]
MAELVTVVVLLAAMVVAVPVAKRFGFGAPLGYLAAGLVVGPAGLGLVTDVGAIAHASELGVVLLLFLIGLELRPARLWVMRKAVLGLGGAQVIVTAVVVGALAAFGLGLPLPAAVVLGFGLALSSTAMVLPMLAERELLAGLSGRNAFSILLFQDLAIIPAVALLPLLGNSGAMPDADGAWLAVAKGVGAIALVLVGGRYLVRPAFRAADSAKSPEIFTATVLLIVIGTAVFVQAAGLSMSLGAFMAGVLLSDSEYRHEVRADIEPFEGLLLGLFFVSVGMAADIPALLAEPVRFIALALGLMLVKAAVLVGLGRFGGLRIGGSVRMATVLSQGGEFGFVLFGLAVSVGAMTQAQASAAMLVVTLSMLATPFLFSAEERWLAPRLIVKSPRPFDRIETDGSPVLICGFGRVGQIVGRILRLRGIPFTALEKDAAQVDFVRRFGNKVFYGDPTRPELLRAAGAETARVLVVALADVEESLRVVEIARRHFPNLTILARARNRRHAHYLMDRGVTHIVRETLDSSLRLTGDVLQTLGLPQDEVARTLDTFRAHDERTLLRQHAVHHDETRLIQTSRQAAAELQALFEADRDER